jgi:uncharacterized protein YcfL
MRGLVRNFNLLLVVSILLVIVQSCKSHRHLVRFEAKPTEQLDASESLAVLNRLHSEVAGFSNLQVRGRAQLTLQGKDQQEVQVQIRMIRDEAIWISATAFLGTEVGRLLITPDEVVMINRLERTFMQMPYSALLKGIDFETLQNVFAALPVSDTATRSSWEISKNQVAFKMVHQGSGIKGVSGNRWEQWVDRESLSLEFIRFTAEEQQEFRILYNWDSTLTAQDGDFKFPNRFSIELKSLALTLQCTVHVERVQTPEDLALPFTIPGNYIQVNSLQYPEN